MKRKLLSIVLALCLTLTLLPTATFAAGSYADTNGHWAEAAIERWSGYGILQGADGRFSPDGTLTRAQMATILSRLLALPEASSYGFTDVAAGDWFADAIDRCAAAGIMQGTGGKAEPNAPITREQAMVMLCRALGIDAVAANLSGYPDGAQVSAYAAGYVAALVQMGIVKGDANGKLNPAGNITRAEIVTIIDRLITVYANVDGAVINAANGGTVLVTAKNVSIANAPEGTKVIAAKGADGLSVNGKPVAAGQTYIVPSSEDGTSYTPGTGTYVPHKHTYTYTDNGDGTHTGVCACGNSTVEKHTIKDGRCVLCRAVLTTDTVASVKNSDGTYTYFETLADAIGAANAGDTVTVVKDIEVSITEEKKVGLLIDKSITLDGNGKTFTFTGDGSGDTYGIYANSEDAITVAIKDLTVKTTGMERAIRFGGAAGGSVEDVKVEATGVGIHVKGTGEVTISNTEITINTCEDFQAHKRAGIVVGSETTVTLNDSTIVVNAPDKTESTTTWGKGAYVGTNAKGTLIINNSSITADFALAIDGSSDESKLNNITVNSGTITGELGSPSGYSYKEIIVNGGTFHDGTVNELNSGFYDKDSLIARLLLNGGTFDSEPAEKFIGQHYKVEAAGGVWNVVKKVYTDYPENPADVSDMPAGVEIVDTGDKDNTFVITLKDEEAFLYFTQVFDRQKAFEARKAAWDAGTITKYPHEYNQSDLNMWYGAYCNKITVKMGCDVDLQNMLVSPFGFGGYVFNFDGDGHTISNAKIEASTGDVGFFAARVNIKNVTLDGIHVSATGCDSAGVVAGAPNSIIENVTVKNSSVTGAKYTGAIAGYDYGDVTNCTVENTGVTGQYKTGGIIGYICGEDNEYRTVTGNTLTNVTVKGDNIWPGKESNGFVIGKIVGNWNAINGICSNNTFTGTTEATGDIGEIESRCTNVTVNGKLQPGSSLSAAIENAAAGGEIALAASGEEYELPDISKSMTISGELGENGEKKVTLASDKSKITSENVTIKDVTIKGSGSANTGGTLNISGNNTTLENVDYQGDGNIAITVSTGNTNTGTIFRNTKIIKAFRGIQFWSLSGDSRIEGCVLDVAGYTFNIDAAVAGSTLTVKDSTLNGWTSYTSGIKLVSFENCKLGLNAYEYLRPYSETTITNCEFTSAGYQLNAGGSGAYTITLTNCTKNGVAITAENVVGLLLDTEGWNGNVTLIVNGTTVTVP